MLANAWRGATVLGGLMSLLAQGAQADALPLWDIEGASNRVTILGSIHFLRPGADTLEPGMLEAYEQADVVIMEIDLDDLDPIMAQATVQRLGTDPQGRTLQDLLGGREYRRAQDKAREIGFDLAPLRSFEPWLAALTITQLQLAQLGFDPASGIEQQLLRLAMRDRKEIRGLETLEQQLAALDSLPRAAQSAFLLQTLDEAAEIGERVEEIVSAWRAGDTRAMEKEFLHDLRAQPELYNRLVVERNRNWAHRIRPLLEERADYLVVVGALHLVGEDSLLGMLEAAGYRPAQRGRAAREAVAD